ncbi:hypothetical protein Acr_25g0002680 [Actinidia rufa]|uniref:Reverse transcriptase domain-containing protein n=1 Tax=Actinidia rufa TaxID=165716 RepID=A0A7J0GYF3_9ERIC|nr:hypothetical protein Acr_25g0002680 [Actinidia rufa]
MCIDYRRLNAVTTKDHFPLPFLDQVLERVAGWAYYCFLDGYSGYNQLEIAMDDQDKTTFTCPFGTFAYKRMPFGLCNAPATFQRCMISFFSDMVERILEVFMDDFSVYEDTYDQCLENLELVLKKCEESNLVLNWEKCHFMVTQVGEVYTLSTSPLFGDDNNIGEPIWVVGFLDNISFDELVYLFVYDFEAFWGEFSSFLANWGILGLMNSLCVATWGSMPGISPCDQAKMSKFLFKKFIKVSHSSLVSSVLIMTWRSE